MKTIQFKKFEIATISAADLYKLINTPHPAYLAEDGGKAMLYQATTEGTIEDGTMLATEDESDLLANRIAIGTIATFSKIEGVEKPTVPVTMSYRTIGELDQNAVFGLIGKLSAKLVEHANATGKSFLQSKIDIDKSAETSVVVYRLNGGGSYKVELARDFFGYYKVTAIDAAIGQDVESRQIVIGGIDTKEKAAVARFSPYTGVELTASSTHTRMALTRDATDVKDVAIDRQTLTVTVLVQTGIETKGYSNERGSAKTFEVKGLEGANALRFKHDGLYAFNAEGQVVFFDRKNGAVDLTTSQIVLKGVDRALRLLDVSVETSDKIGTKRTATFVGRGAQKSGSRMWITQELQAAA